MSILLVYVLWLNGKIKILGYGRTHVEINAKE